MTSDNEGPPDAAESLTTDVGDRRRLSVPPFSPGSPAPGARWGRFEIVSLLGAGGMGQVFLARDPTLERQVALKLLHRDDPILLERFLLEARAQARVEHEHVCKVYEVGAVEGSPYIAMQYVAGPPLGHVAAELRIEERVRLMRLVAEAVHAAHRAGLIHRDLKPSNVLVERGEDGAWRPIVVDFGLAREPGAAGLTATGVTLGTPYYMAPEQVRGETHALDRRTDVYGLGATLYELLTGRPPFAAEGSLAVLMKVVSEEPIAPRAIAPSIPVDLETITLKCLEKEPARRYDSARALAEDLAAYLDGEPVRARRAGPLYRLGKRVRKHRTLTAVLALAVLLAGALLAVSLRAGWRAREQAALGRRFGQEIAEMRNAMRIASLLPLHDLRPDKAGVRERMRRLEAEARELGPAARGPAAYAAGMGHLALGEAAPARARLEDAWGAGFREPEVAAALGLALGALYQEQLEEVEHLRNAELREQRRAAVERELRAPALAYLRQGRGAESEVPEYSEALLAFYGKDFDGALARARAARERQPWLVEAIRLEGDVALARGRDALGRGKHEAARTRFAEAGAAYARALEVARSDAASLLGACRLRLAEMTANVDTGGEMSGPFAAADRACSTVLVADGESADALQARAYARYLLGQYELDHGADPRPTLELAIADGERSRTLRPGLAAAHNIVGVAGWKLGEARLRRGEDPHPTLARAVSSLREAVHADPGYSFAYNNVGAIELLLAQYESDHGGDSTDRLRKAVAAFGQAAEMNPTWSIPFSNQGLAEWQLGQQQMERGGDPRPDDARALEHFERSIAINPADPRPHNNIGAMLLDLARFAASRGEAWRPLLDRAEASFRRAIELNPNHPLPRNGLGETFTTRGDLGLAEGSDPQPAIAAALEIYGGALTVNPQYANAIVGQADAHLVLAEYLLARGTDPRREIDVAQGRAEAALALRPDFGDAFRTLAQTHLLAARARLLDGRSPAAALDEAAHVLARAATVNPDAPEPPLAQALVELLRARAALARPAEATSALARAAASLTRAESLAPEGAEARLARGEQARLEAILTVRSGRPVAATVALDAALAELAKALHRNPGDAAAMALRGELALLAGRAATDPAARQRHDAEGRAALAEALRRNPLLRRDVDRALAEGS